MIGVSIIQLLLQYMFLYLLTNYSDQFCNNITAFIRIAKIVIQKLGFIKYETV